MPEIIKFLQCTPNILRFMPQKDITLNELQSLFHMSRKHWNQHTDFDQKQLQKNKIYTLSFKAVSSHVALSDKEVTIVYEDMFCVVAFKPCFLLVHSDGNEEDTLQARVNSYLQKEGWIYPCQAIHRIDKETSGLVLFSKFPFFQPYFDHQVESHILEKEYQCFVKGHFPKNIKVIEKNIGRDRHNAKKMRISKNGKPGMTKIINCEYKKYSSLLTIQIKTGRKHQIRVHLSSLGYPILNDSLYGTVYDQRGLLLQSTRLSFYSPFQNNKIMVVSPIDKRMSESLSRSYTLSSN